MAELCHGNHKYIERRRGSNGRWVYVYKKSDRKNSAARSIHAASKNVGQHLSPNSAQIKVNKAVKNVSGSVTKKSVGEKTQDVRKNIERNLRVNSSNAIRKGKDFVSKILN